MSNRKLGLLVALRSPEALESIRVALARREGAKAAAESLGVDRSTLCRRWSEWPAVARLLKKYTLDTSEVGAMGGATTAERYAEDGHAWKKRGARKGRK